MIDHTRALAYVYDFLSFVFLQKKSEIIDAVYLFGSAVRGELDENSDIDLFVQCKEENEDQSKKIIELAESNFRKSNDFAKWKNLDFVYPISVKYGDLSEWQLKTSIEAEGIEVFSKFIRPQKLERVVLFFLKLPKDKKRYLSFTRELFGRKERSYNSVGLIEKAEGKKLGSNVFLVPKEHQNKAISLLHKYKIDYKMMELLR